MIAKLKNFDHGTGADPENAMTRSQLVDRLAAENPHLTRQDIDLVVAIIFEAMTQTLAHGRRVELRGFGAFDVRDRPAKIGRNPRTGEPVQVRAKAVPVFRSGKELRQRLNAGEDA